MRTRHINACDNEDRSTRQGIESRHVANPNGHQSVGGRPATPDALFLRPTPSLPPVGAGLNVRYPRRLTSQVADSFSHCSQSVRKGAAEPTSSLD